MDMDHTPLPWKIEENIGSLGDMQLKICGALGQRICEMFYFDRQETKARADADYAVKACNNHSALIEQLQAFAQMSEYRPPKGVGAEAWRHKIMNARDLLKSISGE